MRSWARAPTGLVLRRFGASFVGETGKVASLKHVGWLVGVFVVLTGCGSNSVLPDGGDALNDLRIASDTEAAGATDAADTRTVLDGAGDAVTESRSDTSGVGAPTWTGIYADLFTNPTFASNCMGSSCHDPGIQHGIDLSTAAKGFMTLQHHIVPGQPSSSSLYTQLASGSMPRGKPRLSDAELARVRAWILAGAPNN